MLFGVFLLLAVSVTNYVAFLVLATIGNAIGDDVFVDLLKYSCAVRSGVKQSADEPLVGRFEGTRNTGPRHEFVDS